MSRSLVPSFRHRPPCGEVALDLTDTRWERVAPLIRNPPRRKDGRPLRRYRHRWKVERRFAWLQNYRRLITRHERHPENFLGFVRLGCIGILLRHFWDGF